MKKNGSLIGEREQVDNMFSINDFKIGPLKTMSQASRYQNIVVFLSSSTIIVICCYTCHWKKFQENTNEVSLVFFQNWAFLKKKKTTKFERLYMFAFNLMFKMWDAHKKESSSMLLFSYFKISLIIFCTQLNVIFGLYL